MESVSDIIMVNIMNNNFNKNINTNYIISIDTGSTVYDKSYIVYDDFINILGSTIVDLEYFLFGRMY